MGSGRFLGWLQGRSKPLARKARPFSGGFAPADLLRHLLRDQANVLVEIGRQSTARVDAIEDNLLKSRITVSRPELSSLRRVLVRLQRLLAPEPAALFRLLSRPPGWIGEADLQDLRQSAEEFSASVADSAALTGAVGFVAIRRRGG
jgi:zinc transporter